MKETELRVGNLVTRKSVPNICYVNYGVIQDIEIYSPTDYLPIPISEDWLEKLGFKKEWDEDGSGDYDYVKKIDRYLFIVRSQDLFSTYQRRDIGLKYEPLTKEIKYIHQLQNLYYALTEQELAVIGSLPSGDNGPYFGWCNVDGCEREGCSGGNAWRETGYWTVCHKHADEYRAGKPQPKMKQKYIDREKSRLPDGTLPVARLGGCKKSNYGTTN